MRDGAEDVEHEFVGGRGGVEALLEAHQVDASDPEGVNGFEQLAQRPAQPVEPGDAEPIPGPSMVDELGESRALEALSGDDVDEHPDGAGVDEPDSLTLEVLVGGGHARVTQRVAGAGRVARTKIDRFRDGLGVHSVSSVTRD